MTNRCKKETEPAAPPMTPAARRAMEEGELRRREYLLSLDPRQRMDLAMGE